MEEKGRDTKLKKHENMQGVVFRTEMKSRLGEREASSLNAESLTAIGLQAIRNYWTGGGASPATMADV